MRIAVVTSSPPMAEGGHMVIARDMHPEQLYLELARLAGALCTFTQDAHPREVPAYDHDDLGPCFHKLDEMIRYLLETVVPSNFVSLPLKLTQV